MPSSCRSSSDFLQSHYTVLLSSFLLPFFQVPLDVVVHFLVFLRPSRVKSVLCQFSPVVAQIKNFCSDVCKDLTVVLKVVIIESMPASSLLMMVIGANFPPITAWKVSSTLAYFSFSRSNLSLVCFGLLILSRRRWKVTISTLWSLPVSALGKLRVLAIFTPDRRRFLTRM